MKKVLFIIFIIYLIGCVAEAKLSSFSDYEIVEIDGCKYIVTPNGICHKGNCKNIQHSWNKP